MLTTRVGFALVVSSLLACTATTTSGGSNPGGSSGQTGEPPPSATGTTTSPTPPPPPPPAEVTFGYSSVSLPSGSPTVRAIGGSSATDVWIIGYEGTSSQNTPYTAYHYDGAKWTSQTLSVTTGRPCFGVVSLGGDQVYAGFSYAGDVYQITASSMTKRASFSVTSGYSMAAVGSKVYVGTQENFGAGPLYVFDGTSSKQAKVTAGSGGVLAIWGASDDDVWLARSSGLGHLAKGTYEDVDAVAASDVHGTSSTDVWAATTEGVRHYDGKSWSAVALPNSGEEPATVSALSKNDVVVTTERGVYRWDGKAFAAESRTGAPKDGVSRVARIGKDEAWFVTLDGIARLSPVKK